MKVFICKHCFTKICILESVPLRLLFFVVKVDYFFLTVLFQSLN